MKPSTKQKPGTSKRLDELFSKWSKRYAHEVLQSDNDAYHREHRAHDELSRTIRQMRLVVRERFMRLKQSAAQAERCKQIADAKINELLELHELLKAVRPDLALRLYNTVYVHDQLTPLQRAEIVAMIHEELTKARNKRPGAGRKVDPATQEVSKFCYEEYRVKKRKLAAVRNEAAKRFGDRAPNEDSHVATYADRYAKSQQNT